MPAVTFEDYTFDLDRRLLLRGDEPRHLAPKTFELLRILIAERPNVVSKRDLMTRLWPDAFVTENNLATLVTDLRAALDDAARRPRLIRTVHAVGYAFTGTVVEPQNSARATARAPSGWKLMWDQTELGLCEGVNIIGRPADGVIGFDSPTVSRRHARIVVTNDRATIEDLQSKNGTWVDLQPASSPTALKDGQTIRLGSVVVTVRMTPRADSTQTMEMDTRPLPNG